MEKLTPLQIIGAAITGLAAAGALFAFGYWLLSAALSIGDDPQREKHPLPNDLKSGQLYYMPRTRDGIPMSKIRTPEFAMLPTMDAGI